MSILRGVFEGDLNCDCIFTRFFAGHQGFGSFVEKMSINRNLSRTECNNSLEMSVLRGVFEGDINCDCIFTGLFEDPEAGGTAGRDTGGTQVGQEPPQHFK